ncbi:MAG: PRC-barrel domain-containing protein [Synechococcus sp.]
MTGSELRSRFRVLGSPVIDQATAAQIGIVSSVWVDLEAQRVVALSVRDSAFDRVDRTMELSDRITIGRDAILVQSDDVFEDFDLSGLVRAIGTDVVTETGTRLGRVKDFMFDPITGEIADVHISSLGVPLVPAFLSNTYGMKSDRVVSVGGDIIAADETEAELFEVSTSVITKLIGVGRPPWELQMDTSVLPSAAEVVEEDEEAYYDKEYEGEYEEEYEEEYEDTARDYDAEEYEDDIEVSAEPDGGEEEYNENYESEYEAAVRDESQEPASDAPVNFPVEVAEGEAISEDTN